MFKKFYPLVCVLILWSCGAASNDSTVITPSDSISSTVKVRFNSANDTITVLEKGRDAQSQVFEICSLDMSPITGDLPYNLVDQNTLELGSSSFAFKRALTAPKTEPGVASRIFSVWGNPDIIREGVTLSLEVAIEADQLTFRMNCSG
ncbi:MAG TPA: hypothetical protein VFO10_26225 [Oligoflexus sp.]|uniref:hypothetical protein n=1 Tax=Oligoflexus sp. TaxID=1971216 RepID=UPI002D7FA0A3|nr:hypothetical protein [Oligoflexus sp.]HET9240789.1 hypothetical protein [Oligoflexus sp.]